MSLELSVRRCVNPSTPCWTMSLFTLSFPKKGKKSGQIRYCDTHPCIKALFKTKHFQLPHVFKHCKERVFSLLSLWECPFGSHSKHRLVGSIPSPQPSAHAQEEVTRDWPCSKGITHLQKQLTAHATQLPAGGCAHWGPRPQWRVLLSTTELLQDRWYCLF